MTPITIATPAWGTVAAAGPQLWRVHERHGRIIGHVRVVPASQGVAPRFRAERFHAASHGFRTLGEFASAEDAMATLRG